MKKLFTFLAFAFLLQGCFGGEEYELRKYYRDPYSPAALMMGGMYAGVVERFDSQDACLSMKEGVEEDDRKIGYTNSRFVCAKKGSPELDSEGMPFKMTQEAKRSLNEKESEKNDSPTMHRYANRGGDSGVVAYGNGSDFMLIQFESSDKIYKYTSAKFGASAIKRMRYLAERGEGLNSFINSL